MGADDTRRKPAAHPDPARRAARYGRRVPLPPPPPWPCQRWRPTSWALSTLLTNRHRWLGKRHILRRLVLPAVDFCVRNFPISTHVDRPGVGGQGGILGEPGERIVDVTIEKRD